MRAGCLTGEFPGWRGYYREWPHIRKACESAAAEAVRLGVRMVCGAPCRAGTWWRCLYGVDGDVAGARTAEEEARLYRDTSVPFNIDKGFFAGAGRGGAGR